jgi:signal transduction histidine kinase
MSRLLHEICRRGLLLVPLLGWVAVGHAAEVRVALTPAQQAWVQAHPQIRVGYDPDWPPFSFHNAAGQFNGIDADVLQLLAARTGLALEPVRSRDWTEAYQRALRGEVDVLIGTARTLERERKFHFTATYLSFPAGIITRTNTPFFWSVYDLEGKVVAGPRNYATMTELAREYPEVKLHYTETVAAALELVADGGADAVVTNLANASFIIKTRGLTSLKIAGIMPRTFDLHYAVRQDWPELVGILDAGMASITKADLQALNHRWVRVDYAKVIRWDLVWKTAAVVLAVLGAVIGFLIWHHRGMKRELAKRREVQQALEAANTRLNQANAELQARHAEKNELMRVAAHDLRNPLTALMLGAGWLQEVLEGSEKNQAGGMVAAAQQMMRLLDDVIEVHALEEGRRKFSFARVELVPLVSETLRGLASLASHKRITLDTDGLGAVPAVWADPGAVREVVENLVSNAVKFSPPGRCVRLALVPWNQYARLEIRDEGPGVPDSEKERIFSKYTKGTAQPTGGEKSTGLGLAIVRELVAAMNGRVWCEDAPDGGGTVFVVVIPLVPPVV